MTSKYVCLSHHIRDQVPDHRGSLRLVPQTVTTPDITNPGPGQCSPNQTIDTD